jgi:hypothetical protein
MTDMNVIDMTVTIVKSQEAKIEIMKNVLLINQIQMQKQKN